MVLGSISPTFTPPEVMMASAMGPGTPDMDHKALQDLQQAAALPLVMSWAFRSPGMPVRAMTVGTISLGTKLPRTF